MSDCLINYASDSLIYNGGITLGGATTDCPVVDNDSYNNGDSETAGYGLVYGDCGNSDYNIVVANNLRGNQTDAAQNSPGANTVVSSNIT